MIILKVAGRNVVGVLLDLFGSGYERIASCFEYGNEPDVYWTVHLCDN